MPLQTWYLVAVLVLPVWSAPDGPLIFAVTGDNGWSVTNGKNITVSARTPGDIYADLQRGGVIGDPLADSNDVDYKWIALDHWTYKTNFSVPPELLAKRRRLLVIHGVHLFAHIILNDRAIARTSNMFVRHEYDVGELLSGHNQIRLSFESALAFVQYSSECLFVHEAIHGACGFTRVRTMPAIFGWDWGPSFPGPAIYKPIDILAFDSVYLQDILVNTVRTGEKWSILVAVSALLTVQSVSDALEKKFIMSANLDGQDLDIESPHVHVHEHRLQLGVETVLTIPKTFSVEPWFPQGLDNGGPKTYSLTVRLRLGTEESAKTVVIGFRELELVKDPLRNYTGASAGNTMYLTVNKRPIFLKGSNYVPQEILLSRRSLSTSQYLLQSLVDAKGNALRVWGGGLYEDDEFYDLCDKLGILVLQDFMFASLGPNNHDLAQQIESIKVEVHQQVWRLQHHPSIAIWFGSNELNPKHDKKLLTAIEKEVVQIDKSRPFLDSSPTQGGEELLGDIHYYEAEKKYWNDPKHPIPRMCTEFGETSFPTLSTLRDGSKRISDHCDDSTLQMLTHRSHDGDDALEKFCRRLRALYGPVCQAWKGNAIPLREVIYLGQLAQALSTKVRTEHFLRWRSRIDASGRGFTMGALYWQLNDVWQGLSWSSIDYNGKWKLLHNFAKRFFSSLWVSFFTENGKIQMWLSNDLEPNNGNYTISVTVTQYGFKSFDPVRTSTTEFQARGSSSQYLASHDDANLESFYVATASLSKPEGITRPQEESYFIPVLPRNLQYLPDSDVQLIKISDLDLAKCVFEVELAAATPALYVFLDSNDINGHFDDNGFIMWQPRRTVTFRCNPLKTAVQPSSEALRRSISIYSLNQRLFGAIRSFSENDPTIYTTHRQWYMPE